MAPEWPLPYPTRSFSPWDGSSPMSHPTCDVPFPPLRTGEYRDDLGTPFCTRGSGDRFGIPKPRESGSVFGVGRTGDGLGPLVFSLYVFPPPHPSLKEKPPRGAFLTIKSLLHAHALSRSLAATGGNTSCIASHKIAEVTPISL